VKLSALSIFPAGEALPPLGPAASTSARSERTPCIKISTASRICSSPAPETTYIWRNAPSTTSRPSFLAARGNSRTFTADRSINCRASSTVMPRMFAMARVCT